MQDDEVIARTPDALEEQRGRSAHLPGAAISTTRPAEQRTAGEVTAARAHSGR